MINKYHRALYILEFNRNKDFLRVKEDVANERHRSIIEALRAAAPEWTFEQMNFVAGRRGAVVEDDFYNKLEKPNVQAGKRTKFCWRMCNAYAKRMTQQCDSTISKYMGRLRLTRQRRWRTLENKCMCK